MFQLSTDNKFGISHSQCSILICTNHKGAYKRGMSFIYMHSSPFCSTGLKLKLGLGLD